MFPLTFAEMDLGIETGVEATRAVRFEVEPFLEPVPDMILVMDFEIVPAVQRAALQWTSVGALVARRLRTVLVSLTVPASPRTGTEGPCASDFENEPAKLMAVLRVAAVEELLEWGVVTDTGTLIEVFPRALQAT